MPITNRQLAARIGTLLVVLAAPVGAQTIFTGFTNGCFYQVGNAACTPASTNVSAPVTLGPLTYLNSTFNVTTVNGSAAIGNTVNTPNVDNLGSIALPAGPVGSFDYSNQRFVLNVIFTAPAGAPAGNNLFTAVLNGTVSGTAGGVNIDFDNTPRLFTFNGGSFTFRVDDVSLTKNNVATSIALSGFITTTTVPEPGTYALMGAGLISLAATRRRRPRA